MEFIGMSSNFPSIFKSPKEEPTSNLGSSGQNVICTPEVSLYQYNGNDMIHAKRSPLTMGSHLMEGVIKPASDLPDPLELIGPNGNFQCGFCGKSFQQKNTFQNHLRSHREGEDPYQCDICQKTFAVPARLTRHYRTHTGEKPYQCEYCNKSFSVKENLSVHRRIHTKERPYKCEVCERAFEHSGKLHRHMRIHTGERPHRCQICQKTFIQSGQLVIHMRTHTGEKPYVCKTCNKGFTCSKQLKVHTRTHTGEKPYTCDICGKSFGYNHVLKLHQVAHYGEKVYKCTLCNSTFNSKKSLETHIKTHSSDPSSSPSVAEIPDLIPASQTPQNSDKENRESSDSEISLQNSPTALESPRSSPSPIFTSNFKSGGRDLPNERRQHQQSNLPYPMLPPGVQVHQPPQSRTTFLYVTSKLPNLGGSTSQPSEPQPSNRSTNLSFKQFGMNGGSSSGGNEGAPFSGFLQSATIRDKVLASIEKFGYGIPTSGTINDNSNSSCSNGSLEGYPSHNPSSAYNPTNRGNGSSSGSGAKFDFEEFGDNYGKRSFFKSERADYIYNPYNRPSPYSSKLGGRAGSPEDFGKYSSGRVLALALTRGSKAVANQLPLSVSLTPIVPMRDQSPHLRNSDSPSELCIDFSRRAGSVSPRHSLTSPTPSQTSRSTPGLSESAEDLSDEYSSGANESRHEKHGKVSFGPRKRSSLILEKYAQENPSPIQISTESILAQRLRLSSVIQYAEKCT